MFSEETSVFSVEYYFAMFSDIAKTGSGSSRALSELVEFIFPLPYVVGQVEEYSGLSSYTGSLNFLSYLSADIDQCISCS